MFLSAKVIRCFRKYSDSKFTNLVILMYPLLCEFDPKYQSVSFSFPMSLFAGYLKTDLHGISITATHSCDS